MVAKQKLQYKFLKEFIVPLFCGILISMLSTGILIFYFTLNLVNDQSLVSLIKTKELNVTMPILLSASESI